MVIDRSNWTYGDMLRFDIFDSMYVSNVRLAHSARVNSIVRRFVAAAWIAMATMYFVYWLTTGNAWYWIVILLYVALAAAEAWLGWKMWPSNRRRALRTAAGHRIQMQKMAREHERAA